MPHHAQFEVYEAESGDGWNWRLRAKNGEIIAQSNQGYNARHRAVDACKMVHEALRNVKVEIVSR